MGCAETRSFCCGRLKTKKNNMGEYKMEGILKQNKELLCKSEDKQCPFYSDPSYDILFNSNKIILSPGQQLTNIL